jgi:succinate dehydrogenase hydrophobic anchor subunit
MKLKWEGLVFTLLWIGLQINCLIWGFHNPLEFEGEYIHIHAWFANLFFVLSNMMLLLLLTSHHNGSSLFKVLENTNSKDVAKLE